MSVDITVVKSHAIGQPAIAEPEQIERRALEASALHDELCEQRAFAKAEAWLGGAAPALIAALDKFDQPATKNDIATQVMMLLAAFPNASRPELKIYSKTLAEDIGAMQPGRLALEWACRRLRRTCKFVPAIAEVLEGVTDAGTRIRSARWLVTKRIPQMIEEMKKERERSRFYEERWRRIELEYEERCRAAANKQQLWENLSGEAAMSDRFTRDKMTWLDQVFRDRAISDLGFKVAYAIASHMNRRKLWAWPTYETLANETGAERRSVMRIIDLLARHGHLSISRARGRHPNRYRWVIGDGQLPLGDGANGDSGVTVETPNGDSGVHPTVTLESPATVTLESPRTL